LSIPSVLYNVLRSSVFNLFVMSSASRFSVFLYEYYEITTPATVYLCVLLLIYVPRAGSREYCTLDSFDFVAIYIVCLFTSYAFPLLHFFPYLSFPLRIDLLHFQARGRKRRPNLGFLAVLIYFML